MDPRLGHLMDPRRASASASHGKPLHMRVCDPFRHAPNVATVIAGSLILPRQPWDAHSVILRSAQSAISRAGGFGIDQGRDRRMLAEFFQAPGAVRPDAPDRDPTNGRPGEQHEVDEVTGVARRSIWGRWMPVYAVILSARRVSGSRSAATRKDRAERRFEYRDDLPR